MRAVVVIAAAFSLGFAPATVPARAGVAGTAGVPAYRVADLVRVAYAAGLPELGRTVSAPPSEAEPPDAESWALPVPDLDGDGRDDVMDVRARDTTTPEEEQDGYSYADFTSVARSGRDGRELWRRSGRRTAMLPFPARVGPAGERGVLEIHVDVNWARLAVVHLGFVALDGRGRVVAERHYDEQDGAVPYWGGFVPAPGAPAAVLLGLLEPQPNGGVLFQPAVAELAGDAVARPNGPAIVTGPVPAAAVGIGDLDGDGRHDYAIAGTDLLTPPGAFVEARSARDGTVLWRVPSAPGTLFGSPNRVGDVTADGVPDVAVQSSRLDAGRTVAEVVLHDGADGAVRWTVGGHAAYPLGSIDGAPGDEAGVAVREAPVSLSAYGAAGTPLWTATGPVAADFLEPYGDVDGDGVGDLFFSYSTGRRPTPTFGVEPDAGAISGRTGAIRAYADQTVRIRSNTAWTSITGEAADPLLGAFDGRTPDFARVDVAGDRSSYTIVALDAWTGAEFWRAPVPLRVDSGGEPRALDLDGDTCADLIVPAIGDGNDLLAFRSDGTLQWAVRRGAAGRDVRLRPRVATTTSFAACR